MKATFCRYLLLGLGLGVMTLVGCAVDQVALPLAPVGPATATIHEHPFSGGYLVVYTPIEEPKIFPDTMFAPHTGYSIYDSKGGLVRVVRNHVGAWDETPDLVSLAPGKYTVRAESETGYPLVVPVRIRAEKTTSVDLQWREPHLANE